MSAYVDECENWLKKNIAIANAKRYELVIGFWESL